MKIYADDSHSHLNASSIALILLAFLALGPPPRGLAAQTYPDSSRKFGFSVYSTINYYNFNWDTDPKRRAAVDLERLVLEGTYHLTPRIAFEAEVEFEHGGTGSTIEFDPFEEFGEFETEVEKGGEVVVEELHATFTLRPGLDLRFGHFYVPIGWMSSKYTPLEYLTVTRPDMELALIPAQWDETGIKLMGRTGHLRYQAGVVNGLDNSGFSSANWIVGGKQRRFETVRAENVAAIGRIDILPLPGVTVGASGYFGNSSGNRPKADLDDPAYVSIVEGHADFERNGWRARGLVLYGWLQNSGAVTEANRQLSNNLNVKRTPVASAALGWSLEAGYDVLRLIQPGPRTPASDGIDLFGRYEYYDSMYRVADGIFDNPRWERHQWTVGFNYRALGHLVLKGQYTDRRLGLPSSNHERTVLAGVGAQF